MRSLCILLSAVALATANQGRYEDYRTRFLASESDLVSNSGQVAPGAPAGAANSARANPPTKSQSQAIRRGGDGQGPRGTQKPAARTGTPLRPFKGPATQAATSRPATTRPGTTGPPTTAAPVTQPFFIPLAQQGAPCKFNTSTFQFPGELALRTEVHSPENWSRVDGIQWIYISRSRNVTFSRSTMVNGTTTNTINVYQNMTSGIQTTVESVNGTVVHCRPQNSSWQPLDQALGMYQMVINMVQCNSTSSSPVDQPNANFTYYNMWMPGMAFDVYVNTTTGSLAEIAVSDGMGHYQAALRLQVGTTVSTDPRFFNAPICNPMMQ